MQPDAQLKPRTLGDHAVAKIDVELSLLPVGQSRPYRGMIVTRHKPEVWIFEPSGFKGPARRAEGRAAVRQEIEHYVKTGKLRQPDAKGWRV
jgi:hypothetical protein